MGSREITKYADFWPYYLAEHSKTGTRLLHLVGTLAGLVFLGVFIGGGHWKLIPLVLIPGYGCAWFAHFFVEHNRPATFKYPFWSFISDYRMVAFMLSGRLSAEIRDLDRRSAVD